MKKLLALLLALLMTLSFVGCNNSGNNEEGGEGGGNTAVGNPLENLNFEKFAMGLMVEDPSELMAIFLGGKQDLGIKDVQLQLATGSNGGVLSLGADLMGEKHNANLFIGQALVLSTTLLNNAYGAKTEDLVGMVMKLLTQDVPAQPMPSQPTLTPMYENSAYDTAEPSQGTSVMGLLMKLPTLKDDVIALITKYYESFINELKTNAGLTLTENGDTFRLQGTVTADAAAVVFINLLEQLMADDDFFALVETLGAGTKEGILHGKPSKEQLLEEFKVLTNEVELGFEADITFNKNNLPTKASIGMTMDDGGYTVDADLSYGDGSFAASLVVNEETVFDVSFGDGKIQGAVNYRGAKMELSVTYSDTALNGSFVMNGTTVFEANATYSATSLNASASLYGEKLFEMTAGNGNVNMKINMQGQEIEMSVSMGKTGIDMSIKLNGQVMMAYSVKIENNKYTLYVNMQGTEMTAVLTNGTKEVTGTLSVNGTEMGNIVFAKKVSGSKMMLTLKTLTVQSTTVDFSKAGLSLYIDTNPSVPSVPNYTSVTGMGMGQLQEIGEEFMNKNAALLEKLSNTLGGLFGGGKSEEAVRENRVTVQA